MSVIILTGPSTKYLTCLTPISIAGTSGPIFTHGVFVGDTQKEEYTNAFSFLFLGMGVAVPVRTVLLFLGRIKKE